MHDGDSAQHVTVASDATVLSAAGGAGCIEQCMDISLLSQHTSGSGTYFLAVVTTTGGALDADVLPADSARLTRLCSACKGVRWRVLRQGTHGALVGNNPGLKLAYRVAQRIFHAAAGLPLPWSLAMCAATMR